MTNIKQYKTIIPFLIFLLLMLYMPSCGTSPNNGGVFVRQNNVSTPLQQPEFVDGVVWSGGINLDWIDTNDHEDALLVQRKLSSELTFSDLATFSAAMYISYTDTDILPQTSYTYRLKVIKGEQENVSEEMTFTSAQASLPPLAPSNIYVMDFSIDTNCQARVRWFDQSDDEDSFRIERTLYTTGSIDPSIHIFTRTSAPLEQLDIGLRYYYDALPNNILSVAYRIKAQNEHGSSAWSPSVYLNVFTCN